jgi:hypothetical protein
MRYQRAAHRLTAQMPATLRSIRAEALAAREHRAALAADLVDNRRPLPRAPPSERPGLPIHVAVCRDRGPISSIHRGADRSSVGLTTSRALPKAASRAPSNKPQRHAKRQHRPKHPANLRPTHNTGTNHLTLVMHCSRSTCLSQWALVADLAIATKRGKSGLDHARRMATCRGRGFRCVRNADNPGSGRMQAHRKN